MNYLVTKHKMSQRQSECVASYLKKKKSTDHVLLTSFRHRHKIYNSFFTQNNEKTMAYCNNLRGLLLAMELEYVSRDRRLFIDGDTSSLKGILLYKSNTLPAIPLYYATDKKGDPESLEELLDVIKYKEHKWLLCCDLKVVAILCGMKRGRCNYACYRCNWNTVEPWLT